MFKHRHGRVDIHGLGLSAGALACAATLGLLGVLGTSAAAQDTEASPRLLRAPFAAGPLQPQGPRLGVMLEDSADGPLVNEVLPDTPAAAAGLQVGDILVRVGDQRIQSAADVRAALSHLAPGSDVSLRVIRAGHGLLEVDAQLPPPAARQEAQGLDGHHGGFLGVQMAERDSDNDGESGEPDAQPPGVLVSGVVEQSAAWFAGLAEGDRLTALDDKPLAGPEELLAAVGSRRPGTLVELVWLRDGVEQRSRVRLGNRPPPGPTDPGGLRALLRSPGGPLPDGLRLREENLNDWLPQLREQFQNLMQRDTDPHGHPPQALWPELRLRERQAPGLRQHHTRVEIDGDRMVVHRDGQIEHFRRDPQGDWVRSQPPAPHGDDAHHDGAHGHGAHDGAHGDDHGHPADDQPLH